jgi:threonine synthase
VSPEAGWPGIVARYRPLLGVGERTPAVTLLEGNTPLLEAPRIGEAAGGVRVYLKCEGANPTGSATDRGMALAVSRACEVGARAVVCASTGDTAASAAAYGARAGIPVFVVVPRVGVAMRGLAQAAMHGATVLMVDASLDRAHALVRELAAAHPVALVDPANPDRLAGQRTAAFEVVDRLGRPPDYHLLPARSPGPVVAHWQAYEAYPPGGPKRTRPRLVACPPAGRSAGRVRPGAGARGAAREADPAGWPAALAAVRASGGWLEGVTAEETRDAYRLLARLEGVLAEPAAAAPVAGLLRAAKAGRLAADAVCVLTLAAHGLKDLETALESTGRPGTVPPRVDALARAMGL